MSILQNISNQQIIEAFKSEGVVFVKKKDLQEMLNALSSRLTDNRVKWITRTEAKRLYGLTKYWFMDSENDPETKLKMDPGTGKTSTKKYSIKSIEEELERRSV